ncbi:MAG TPA: nitrile hydratase subunit beta [Steroidobacteraceae bacterium]|jgi:nitrile hydratase
MTYQSHADVGGQEGYGLITPEPEGELFHADWERMALAITLAMGATGTWNIDESRSVRETVPEYHSLTYYQLWIRGLIELLQRHDLVGEDEVDAGRMLHAPTSLKRVLRAADVPAVLAKGAPTVRPANSPARFAVGDHVRTREAAVGHHTRLPAYARGKSGRIAAVYGPHVFADAHAQGLGEQPQWLYNVVFTARELWGEEGDETATVSIDAWESYLS